MIRTLGITSIFILLSSQWALAQVLNQNTLSVALEVPYIEVEVEVMCQSPKYEDDSFRLYYSEKSYALVSPYFSQGYREVLIGGRTCGSFGSSKEISGSQFETAKMLLFNKETAQKKLDEKVKQLLESYK